MRLKSLNSSEHDEQVTVIQWANLSKSRLPELELLFAIPNSANRFAKPYISKKTGEKLPPISAVRLKAEGVKPGLPDLCLPVARRSCHALYIEMKVGDNRPTPVQQYWHEQLQMQGNCVRVCYSADEAIKVLEWYLKAI